MTADQRREAVVRVAVEVFAREGFHAATTAAIADRAGVSQPYLFRLFATKRAVFLAAAELATGEAARAFTAAARDAGGAGAAEAAGARNPGGVTALRAGERAWRRMLGPGGPFALQWQLHAAAAGDPVVRAAAARHWGVLWRTVASATGLPDPVLVAFFGRVLLRGAATALRPEPPVDTTATATPRPAPPPGTTAAPHPEPSPDTAAATTAPLPRPGPAPPVTTPTAPTARGTRAAPVPAAVRPRPAGR
ncbi:helix-turn-helix domain-containing protein [Kitasatospora fiedleri]|uniref:helix-turn-helix domain-containing protein n=1 Tax=Kitasatospora fiedleri TaxID=2991545 RepID=UPI00384E44C6